MILPSAHHQIHHLHPDVRLALVTVDSIYHDQGANYVVANEARASTEYKGNEKETSVRVSIGVGPLPAGSAPDVCSELEATLPARFEAEYTEEGIVIRSTQH